MKFSGAERKGSEGRLFTVSAPRDPTPVHIVNRPDKMRSLCGIKDPLPVVAAGFVQVHVDGWGMVPCADCLAAADGSVA